VDTIRLLHLPVASPPDPDHLLAELTASIDLVAAGIASRVVVSNLDDIESVAAAALGYAQGLAISFAVARDATGKSHAVIGPRAA
jgi:uncharacterized protein YebE (UPF0316 family)